MRNIDKDIAVSKYIETIIKATVEKIESIVVRPEAKIIDINYVTLDAQNNFLKSTSATISGDDYDLLFSDDPIFEVGKQVGSYREIDLWKIIDKAGV